MTTSSPGRNPVSPRSAGPAAVGKKSWITRRPRKVLAPKTGWRHIVPRLRTTLWVFFGLIVAGFVGLVILYNAVAIPQPNPTALANNTIIYYSDGKTVLATIGEENREIVPFKQIPPYVQAAVLAAEDRNFYHEPGVSAKGILRAGWSILTGGSLQGGSTITQQYVKNAYLTPARTPTRKLKEIVIATKLDQTTSKQDILADYLNTIWFGRGASGIQVAAKAYFGHPVEKLTVAEGAVLAASIQGPARLDPYLHHDAAVARWHYVIDGMVKDGDLTQAQADKLTYPTVLKPHPIGSTTSGPTRFLQNAVLDELGNLDASKVAGLSDKDIQTGGLRVVTTIDYAAQTAAVKAENDVFQKAIASAKKQPVSALVSVEPGTGKIKAMYGGETFAGSAGCDDATGNCTNLATQIKRPPGSTFKSFVLSTALSQGKTLTDTFPGPNEAKLTDGTPVHNDAEKETCSNCTLTTAIARSINTIFEPLAETVGPKAVADQAHALGIPPDVKLEKDGFTGPSIALGTYDVHPIDMAVAYATFAANGTRATPYLVDRVKDAGGAVTYQAKPNVAQDALPAEVAANVNVALQAVMTDPQGTGLKAALDGGRPMAGKTGTTGESKDAWFVGYTPQLSTAVWIGNIDNTTTINQIPGYQKGLYGGGLPAMTFKAFMDGALKGQPVKPFTPPTKAPPSPSPSPSSSLSTSASVSPTPTLTPTVTPTVTPTASVTDVPSVSPTPATSAPSVTPSPPASPTGSPPAPSGGATG